MQKRQPCIWLRAAIIGIARYSGRIADLDFLRFGTEAFLACPEESIDYAVMEKADNLVMLPLDAGWSDIGSWSALWEASAKDNTESCENMVIVETKDAVLVAPKTQVAGITALVKRLKAENRPEISYHRDVCRPWGSYDKVDEGARYQVIANHGETGGEALGAETFSLG